MLMIDMTEEPENEDDIIFKAQNIHRDGEIKYVIPHGHLHCEVCYSTIGEDTILTTDYVLRAKYVSEDV